MVMVPPQAQPVPGLGIPILVRACGMLLALPYVHLRDPFVCMPPFSSTLPHNTPHATPWLGCAVVSDAGAGGQTLMDATTFERIKDRLAELGAVKAEGTDKRQLRGTPRGWLARLIARCGDWLLFSLGPCLMCALGYGLWRVGDKLMWDGSWDVSRPLGCATTTPVHACTAGCCRFRPISWSEAVVLDMGVYSVPSLKHSKGEAYATPAATSAAAAAAAPEGAVAGPAAAAGTSGRAGGSSGSAPKAAPSPSAAAAAEAAGAGIGPPSSGPASLQRNSSSMSGAMSLQPKGGRKQGSPLMAWYFGVTAETHMEAAQHDESLVHLYQVLPPSLLQRARVFGNKLVFPEGSLCHDLPYFCAPAAAVMPLLPVLRSAAGDIQPCAGSSSHNAAGPTRAASGAAMAVTGIPRVPSDNPATPGGAEQRAPGDVPGTEPPAAAAAAAVTGAVGGYPLSSSPSTTAGFVTPSRHLRRSVTPVGVRSSNSFQQMGRSRSLMAGGLSNFSSVWSGLVTTGSKRSASRPPAPAVTFVFCAVEGSKPLKHLM